MRFGLVRVASLLAGILGIWLIDVFAHSFHNDYLTRIVALVGLYVTLAVSLNLINGITGQFSIGHAAFYQVGAYAAAFLSVSFYGKGLSGLPWLLFSVIAAAVIAAIAGFAVGLPSLRLRGDYLAIVTLGFGEIIRILVQNIDRLGGAYGMNVPQEQKFVLVWPCWMLAFICVASCRNLLQTARGLTFLAVREDEIASSAMGVNVTSVKVTAFVLGSAFAGAAGALLAQYEGFITPANFSMDVSFIILTMVVLGGTGSITGSVIAAGVLYYLPEFLRSLKGADGEALKVSGASVIAAVVLTLAAAGVIRRLIDAGKGTGRSRALQYLGIIAVAFVAKPLVQMLLSLSKSLAEPRIEAGNLRMVIFAIALIVIMLLRPQGILGHREFSLRDLLAKAGLGPALEGAS